LLGKFENLGFQIPQIVFRGQFRLDQTGRSLVL
ncbi:unnamed protein product, partial [marine sediment metagenome]